MDTRAAAIGWVVSGGATILLAGSAAYRLRQARPATPLPYALGGLSWTAAVFFKVLLALLLALALRPLFPNGLPLPAQMLTAGLLTGIFECGAVYLFARWTPIRHAAWNDALAFGMGFGCWEAAVLALAAVCRGVVAALIPLLPHDLAAETAAAIGPWHWHVGALLVLERLVALPVHVVTSVLVIRALQTRRASLFWQAFLFKCGIDAIPAGATPLLSQELLYVIYGGVALAWTLRLDREAQERAERVPAVS
jgi:hypothetical protein